jgi:hypothetical protein
VVVRVRDIEITGSIHRHTVRRTEARRTPGAVRTAWVSGQSGEIGESELNLGAGEVDRSQQQNNPKSHKRPAIFIADNIVCYVR